jgi:hypothetical protein
MITSYCILALNRVELAKHTGLFAVQKAGLEGVHIEI